MKFNGYRRSDGRVGTRNYVGVLSTVVCANEVVERIVSHVKGAVAFMHHQGCCQTPIDITRVAQTLIGLGQNPNLHSVLLVSLGCESVVLEEVAAEIAKSGKRVETLVIQETGGAAQSVAKGQLMAPGHGGRSVRNEKASFSFRRSYAGIEVRQFRHHSRACGKSSPRHRLRPVG